MARTIRAGSTASFGGMSLQKLVACISLWRCRARTRKQLLQLEDRQLRDIGIERSNAVEEARKPFWQD